MKRILIVLYGVMICTVTYTFIAFSTDVDHFTLENLCRKSNTIVIAEVASIRSFHQNESREQIFTSIIFNVEEKVKGDFKKKDSFEMVVYGGSMDGFTTTILGMPSFEVGEKTLLFLHEYIHDDFGRNFILCGLSQGKFNIEKEDIYRTDNIPLQLNADSHFVTVSKDNPMNISRFLETVNNFIK